MSSGDTKKPLPRHHAENRVWREAWSATEKIVALAVIRRCYGHRVSSHPSEATIAKDANRSIRTVRSSLETLINGDEARGLLPVFTRHVRGRGWEYALVLDPVSLVEGRKRHSGQLDELSSAISGQGATGPSRITLQPEHEPLAEQLRGRRARLDQRRLREEIAEAAWKKQRAAVDRDVMALARKLLPQYRQLLPPKHREQ